jgi:hypothetical protein
MKLRACLLFALLLGACGQQEAKTYPPEYELNFMRSCLAQGQASVVCTCTWDKIERGITPDEFAAFERLPAPERAVHPMYGQVERYALECVGENATPPASPPAP